MAALWAPQWRLDWPHRREGDMVATTAWDEAKHPRGQPGNAGEFRRAESSPGSRKVASSASAPRRASATATASGKQVLATFRESAESSGVGPEKAAGYVQTAAAVLKRIPEAAARSLLGNLVAVRFYPDLATMKDELTAAHPAMGSGGLIGGGWERDCLLYTSPSPRD